MFKALIATVSAQSICFKAERKWAQTYGNCVEAEPEQESGQDTGLVFYKYQCTYDDNQYGWLKSFNGGPMEEAEDRSHCGCAFGNATLHQITWTPDQVWVICDEGYALPGVDPKLTASWSNSSPYEASWRYEYEPRSDTQGGLLRPKGYGNFLPPSYTCDQSCVPLTTSMTTTCAFGNAIVIPKNGNKVMIECDWGFVLPFTNLDADEFSLEPNGNLIQSYWRKYQCGNSCVPGKLFCRFGNATLIPKNLHNGYKDQLVSVECDDDYVLPGTDLQAHDFWYEFLQERHGGMLRPSKDIGSVPLYTCNNKCVKRKSRCDFGNATVTPTKHRSKNSKNYQMELVRITCDRGYVLSKNGESSGNFWHGFAHDERNHSTYSGYIKHWTADKFNPHIYSCKDSCVPKNSSNDYSHYTVYTMPPRGTTTTTTTLCEFFKTDNYGPWRHEEPTYHHGENFLVQCARHMELPGSEKSDQSFEYLHARKYSALLKASGNPPLLHACGNSCIRSVTCDPQDTEHNVPVASLHMEMAGTHTRRQSVDVDCKNDRSRQVTLICNALGSYELLHGDCTETSSRLLLDDQDTQ